MAKHRAQPRYERVISQNKGKATALLVVPPLFFTIAPVKPEYSAVQVVENPAGSDLDELDSMRYGDENRHESPLVSYTQSDKSIEQKADNAQRVADRLNAEKAAAEAKALENQRLEDERVAQEKEQKRLDAEKQEAEENSIVVEKTAEVQQAESVPDPESPDPEDPSDFDVTDEVQGSEVLAVAERFIGIPYGWGANGPDAYDCSSFVQAVYKEFGIDLPRVSRDQAKRGYAVKKSDLRPGDVITWGDPVYHIAIYAGNGRIIDAPKAGYKIGYHNLWTDNNMQYRRFIG